MSEYPNTITPAQYNEYTASWAALINSGNTDALQQACQAPNGVRFTFLNFSLDQVVALVTTPKVRSIKARFLLMPDAAGVPRFSLALFAASTPAKDDTASLSDYYIPTDAAATTTQTVQPAPGPSTEISWSEAVSWLTDWATADFLTTDMFTTDTGPLSGYNFEVSTFQDPLAAAPPYADQSLFLNLGLIQDPESTSDLVVYIAALNSRTQGSAEGLPADTGYYNGGQACPPNH